MRRKTSRREFLRWFAKSAVLPSLGVMGGVLVVREDAYGLTPPLKESPTGPSSPEEPRGVTFVDVAAEAGLSGAINIYGGVKTKRYLLEEMGGGVAFFDYDHDGWLDIFFVNGTTLEGFPAGKEPSNYLFHNNRDGTFTDVTEKAGLKHSGWGQGVCVGDYDNDGFDDLFVTYWGQNVLYHNNGDGTFTDVTERAGLFQPGPPRWNTGACFVDYDRDGWLDLFVANYVTFDPRVAPLPGQNDYCQYSGIPVACGPQGLSGGTNLLYHNRGDGTFDDVSEKAGVVYPRGPSAPFFVDRDWQSVGSYGFGVAAADFDNDGWPDIYVSCDSAPSLFYHNNHDGTFSEIGITAGCALNQDGVARSGMGVGVTDYDGDGWLDIFRTNFSDEPSTLYRNNGDGTFQEATYLAGLGVNTKYVGMGTGFLDFDNDGWKDIFNANGHVYPEVDRRKSHVTFKEPNLLYRNLGHGRFEDVSARAGPGIIQAFSSHGCAFGDFDNDGDVDIVIVNNNDPPTLLRNDGGNRNNWLMVKCVGTQSNRSGLGTRVRVLTGQHAQMEEVMSGSSFLSQNDLRLHFGLGPATKADLIEVRWPLGLRESFRDIEANQLISLQEGKGIIKLEKSSLRL